MSQPGADHTTCPDIVYVGTVVVVVVDVEVEVDVDVEVEVVVVVSAAAVVVVVAGANVVSVGPTSVSHPLMKIPNPTIKTTNNPTIKRFIIFSPFKQI